MDEPWWIVYPRSRWWQRLWWRISWRYHSRKWTDVGCTTDDEVER
jgi:hypothetical protein